MGMGKKMGGIRPFPRCLHGMSCVHIPPKPDGGRRGGGGSTAIRLIKHDGGVNTYDRPVRAWQLMEEFPKHLVCRSDCFYLGQKTPALSDGDLLVPGQNYFLLPANFFQSALSFATFLRCRTAGRMPPFEVEKTPAGSLRIKVTEEMIFRLQETAGAPEDAVRICTTPQLKKDYELLVGRRQQWKPKLDSISEKKGRRYQKKKKENDGKKKDDDRKKNNKKDDDGKKKKKKDDDGKKKKKKKDDEGKKKNNNNTTTTPR